MNSTMSSVQHDQLAAFMTSLTQLKHRMDRSQGVFPLHHAQLQQRYNQMLVEAKTRNLLPPWMVS